MMELDITELFEEVVRKLPEGLEILYPNGKGGAKICLLYTSDAADD